MEAGTTVKNSQCLVIGVGNVYRSDDGVGIAVARKIQELGLPDIQAVEESEEGAGIIEAWKNRDRVVLIDAVCSGAAPGTIHRFDATSQSLPAQFFKYSTHAFGIAGAIELARVLNQLPKSLIVYGIEGKNFGAGTSLSPEVEHAEDILVSRLLEELPSAIASQHIP